MMYRPEIDGLRALAVVPVILFHAGFELFSGGFVGVDVFFVISGYLITTILIEDIENKRFSIVDFYERRARRILPALFLVMFVCIPFAWMWMLPGQMKDFSQSLVAVSFFASNILFWRESGYFDAAAEEKPLLHTWSLAVEEQYYVLFPIFLLLTWRFGKSKVFWMIVVMAGLSLLLSEWGWRNKATANFYLAPTRAWELFAGSIAAFIVQRRGVEKNNLLALLGLAAIIFSIFAYDKNTPFPSVYALVPVLGAVLIVLFADKRTLAAKLLSTKLFVGIGLISYSAYLWHQPLFAFARIRLLEHPSQFLMLTLSILTIGLAYISWRFVEKPFRYKGFLKGKKVFVNSTIGIVAFLMFGLAGHFQGGFPQKLPEKLASALDSINRPDLRLAGIGCHLGANIPVAPQPIDACTVYLDQHSSKVLLIGDSHLDAIGLQLQKHLSEKNIGSYALSYSGCVPLRDLYRVDQDSAHKCAVYNDAMIEYARKHKFETIIMIARFPMYLMGSRYDNGEGGVEHGKPAYVDVIERSGEKSLWNDEVRVERVAEAYKEKIEELLEKFKVIIFAPTPEVGWDVPQHFAKKMIFESENDGYVADINHDLSRYEKRISRFMTILSNIDHHGLTVYDFSHIFCDASTDRCRANNKYDLYYYDDDHLSHIAAEFIAKDFSANFSEVLR